MKIALLIFSFVIVHSIAYSQWMTSNNHIYNSNSGYVAIGLGTSLLPTSMLHVRQASNTDWATYVSNTGGSGKGLRIQAAANLNTIAIPLFQIDDNYGITKFLVTSNSRVSIGNVTGLNNSSTKFQVVTRTDSVVSGLSPDAGFKTSIRGEIKSASQNSSWGIFGKATQTGTIVTPSVGVAGAGHDGIWAGFFYGNLGYSGNFGNPSDARLKENVEELNSSLQKILNLKPKTFSFRKDLGLGLPSESQVGFIAQEVQAELPSLIIKVGIPKLPSQATEADSLNIFEDVSGEKYLAVNYIKMIPYIVKAIQEQNDAIKKQSESIGLLLNALASTSIDQNTAKPDISIFPNPANSIISIKVESNVEFDVILYDKVGNMLLTQGGNLKSTNIMTDKFASGTYFISVLIQKDIVEVKRIFINK
jgi:hypothetical protein